MFVTLFKTQYLVAKVTGSKESKDDNRQYGWQNLNVLSFIKCKFISIKNEYKLSAIIISWPS